MSRVANHDLLVVEARGRACGFPLKSVREIMRPLPVEACVGAPVFVRGVSIIRGSVTPVVDLVTFLAGEAVSGAAAQSRLVVLAVGERQVAVAVDGVRGVRSLPDESLVGLPPLLAQAGNATIESMSALDGEFLVVLEGARLLSDSLLNSLTV